MTGIATIKQRSANRRLSGGCAGKCLMDNQFEFGINRAGENKPSETSRHRQQ